MIVYRQESPDGYREDYLQFKFGIIRYERKVAHYVKNKVTSFLSDILTIHL